MYCDLGRLNEAIDAFKQTIRINPSDAEAHFLLGSLYSSNGDKGSALEEYKVLKDIDKDKAGELFNSISK